VLKSCACAAQIAEPLSIIFQKSYDAGELPTVWTTATVTPVYKKGKRTDPGNYRPTTTPQSAVAQFSRL